MSHWRNSVKRELYGSDMGESGVFGILQRWCDKLRYMRSSMVLTARIESADGEIAITPCTQGETSNTFVCGLDNRKCSSSSNTFWLSSDSGLVLRPSQIAALVAPALASSSSAAQATVTASEPSDRAFYTPGAMAGLAAGVAIPLLIICGVLSYILLREKKKWGPNRHMYKLPDNCKEEEFDQKPPPTITATPASLSATTTRPSSRAQSERPTLHSMPSYGSPVTSPLNSPRVPPISSKASFVDRPSNTTSFVDRSSRIQSFAERFGALKSSSASIVYSPEGMHELDSSPAPDQARFELATQRMSK